MYRVLPSHLSDDELLALLGSDEADVETAEIFEYSDDIVPFLSNYNITPGEALVSKKLLYRLYRAYSKTPIDQRNFHIQIGVFLAPTRTHFKINIDQFAISKYIYETEKTRDVAKSLTYHKHFNWFMKEANVSQGGHWLEGFVLFFIYKDFCNSRRVHPKFGYNNFHKFLKLHFPFKRIKENRSLWFKVNEETANIFTKEDRERIVQARQKTGRSQKSSKSEAKKTETE